MKTKITRIATVEFTTIVNGSNIPDLITKVKKHPYQYKWEQEVIGDECWSGEWIAIAIRGHKPKCKYKEKENEIQKETRSN